MSPETGTSYRSVKLRRMNHVARHKRIEEALGDKALDALLVTHMPNVPYVAPRQEGQPGTPAPPPPGY